MARKIIHKTKMKREKGKLYYVCFDDKGFLMIGEAELKRGGGRKKNEI